MLRGTVRHCCLVQAPAVLHAAYAKSITVMTGACSLFHTIMYSVLWTMLCFVEFTRRVDMSEQSTATQQQQQQLPCTATGHDNYRTLSELQHNSNHMTPPLLGRVLLCTHYTVHLCMHACVCIYFLINEFSINLFVFPQALL